MKKIFFVLIIALFALELKAVDAPIVEYKDHSGGASVGGVLIVQARDDIKINNIIINRGNCSFKKYVANFNQVNYTKNPKNVIEYEFIKQEIIPKSKPKSSKQLQDEGFIGPGIDIDKIWAEMGAKNKKPKPKDYTLIIYDKAGNGYIISKDFLGLGTNKRIKTSKNPDDFKNSPIGYTISSNGKEKSDDEKFYDNLSDESKTLYELSDIFTKEIKFGESASVRSDCPASKVLEVILETNLGNLQYKFERRQR